MRFSVSEGGSESRHWGGTGLAQINSLICGLQAFVLWRRRKKYIFPPLSEFMIMLGPMKTWLYCGDENGGYEGHLVKTSCSPPHAPMPFFPLSHDGKK